jgi:hypothetical protein
MLRRLTAREKLIDEKLVCANVFGLLMEVQSPGHDELCRVPVLISRSVIKDHFRRRFQARRCDCSFVLTVPMQTPRAN